MHSKNRIVAILWLGISLVLSYFLWRDIQSSNIFLHEVLRKPELLLLMLAGVMVAGLAAVFTLALYWQHPVARRSGQVISVIVGLGLLGSCLPQLLIFLQDAYFFALLKCVAGITGTVFCWYSFRLASRVV